MEWVRGDAIGQGNFGSVNLAIPINGGGLAAPFMAVKSCALSHSASLRNEKEVMRQLGDCPQIIRCFGDSLSSENGVSLYNVLMEYADGGSLADCLKKCGGGFPESDVRGYARSILKGLLHIHRRGFVHCDIKLQNILLCSAPDGGKDALKIADFGLARKSGVKERGAGDGGLEIRGTPMYMSPESVVWGEYDAPSDIWALGCAVVELVTGKPAWDCGRGGEIFQLFLRIGVGGETPEIPAELSEEGKDFLRECFVRDSKKRWTAETLLNHPFVRDDEDTVPLDKSDGPSTSPRCHFDIPEWVSVASSVCSSLSVTPSLGTITRLETQVKNSPFDAWDVRSRYSPADRVQQLVTGGKPDWSVSESWVTVRPSEEENQ
ncbi:mitogen-activated protein kinase kinase kinase 20 [Malania oleifera]|uniref:mitogen-activated protein kinase kinase kinase 20 n=1 Tax=Malania oleifera TaxID=397392 RepID=UPI0025AE7D67|nr:mitogen-activated protein kinase kinase kinase 20 [Malania oleifera]